MLLWPSLTRMFARHQERGSLGYGVMPCYGKLFAFTESDLRELIAKPEPGALLRDWPDPGIDRSDTVPPEFRLTR